MKKNLIFLSIIFILSIALIFTGIKLYNSRRDNAIIVNNIVALRDSIKTYEIEVNKLKLFVFEQGAIIASKEDAIKSGLLDRERLKKLYLSQVVTNTNLQSEIRVLKDSLAALPDSVFVEYKDTTGTYSAIKLPYSWEYKDQYVSLATGVGVDRKPYFDLGVSLDAEITVGYKKKVPVAILTTSNPYFSANKMEITVVKGMPKWYENRWFYFGGGVLGGMLVYGLLK